ncbi:MAG: hypothetical protein J6X19_01360 [Clostridia bacterium]|nr:hypothetical protein [Clostridia bacterium]
MKQTRSFRMVIVLISVLLCTALLAGCLPGLELPADQTEQPGETQQPVDGTDVPATEAATGEPATAAPATAEPATAEPATEAPATEEPATELPATETPTEPATEDPGTVNTPLPAQLIPASADDILNLWGKVRTAEIDSDACIFMQKTPGGKVVMTGVYWSSGRASDQEMITDVKKDPTTGIYYVTAERYIGSKRFTESFAISSVENNVLAVEYEGEQLLFLPDSIDNHMRVGAEGFGPEGYSAIMSTWGEVRSLYLNGDVYIALSEDSDGRLVATKGKWSDDSAATKAYIIGVSMSVYEDYIVSVERTVNGETVREYFTVNSLLAARVFGTEYEPIKGAYVEDSFADHPDVTKLKKLTNDEIKSAWGYLRSAGGDEWSDYYITLVESSDGELWAELSTWSEGKIFSQVKIIGVWKDNWTENQGKFYVVVEKIVKGESALFYITGSAIDYDTIMTLYFKGAVTMGSPIDDLPATSFIMDSVDNHAKYGSGNYLPYYRNWSEIISQWGKVRTNQNSADEYIIVGAYFGGRLLARKYSWRTDEILNQAYVIGVRADVRYKSFIVTLEKRTDAGVERIYLSVMNGSNPYHDDVYAWTYNSVNEIYYLDSFDNH